MKTKITSNITQVNIRVRAKSAKIKRGISRAISKAGFLVERSAKRRSPVDTGRLRASIRTDIRPLTATIAPHTNYAVFVHNGTRNQRAQPFLTQGLDDALSEIRAVFNREIKGALR